MKQYKIETKQGTDIVECDFFEIDDNMYLNLIKDRHIIAVYSPDFWLSLFCLEETS